MPAAQLATAAIERTLNHLLKLDEQARARLRPLNGKRLKVTIKELPWPLLFHFSERIDVLAQQGDTLYSDCHLELSLMTLEKLQDASQITRLIKHNELLLDGDLNVAQNFSQLVQSIDIDWEEQLSRYTGDVLAHSLFSQSKRLLASVANTLDNTTKIISDALIEEKKWMAHPIAVEDFCADVDKVTSQAARLEARLSQLEKTQQQQDDNS